MKTTVRSITPAFSDQRGVIIDVLDGQIFHTGILTFTKDAVRANHYHKKQTQYTYSLTGTVELCVRDSRTPDAPVGPFIRKPGDLATIPPFVIHAYRALEDASMLCLTDLSRNGTGYEDDTFRVEPLLSPNSPSAETLPGVG